MASACTQGASCEKQKLIHAHICVFTVIAKSNFRAEQAARRTQECQSKKSQPEKVPCGAPPSFLEWRSLWGRKTAAFKGRTTAAERRDQSMIVTKSQDWSSYLSILSRTSHGLKSYCNAVPWRRTSFSSQPCLLEVCFVIVFSSSGLKMGQKPPPSRLIWEGCTQIDSGLPDLQR